MGEHLPHADDAVGFLTYRSEPAADVLATPQTGPRGGRRIPVRVLWRMDGRGLLARGRDIDGRWHLKLDPYVQWHAGDGRCRYTPLAGWIRAAGATREGT